MTNINKIQSRIHKDFNKLFLKKENVELLGKNKRNFWILIVILLVTFIAIGFANGSLKYLEKKMKDPFVNWIDISVPQKLSADISKIKIELNDAIIKDKYKIDKVTGYYRQSTTLFDTLNNKRFKIKYRTVEIDNPVLSQILNKNNIVHGRGFKKESDEDLGELGIIIKEEVLINNNYDINTPYVLMPIITGEGNDFFRPIPIPVIAVVKSIPSLSDFVCTPYFYKNRNGLSQKNIFNPIDEKNLIIYIQNDLLHSNQSKGFFKCSRSILPKQEDSSYLYRATDSVDAFLEDYQKLSPFSTIIPNKDSYLGGHNIVISFWPEIDTIAVLDSIFNNLLNSKKLSFLNNYLRMYDYNSKRQKITEYGRYDRISINFSDLSKVREFSKFLFDKYEIQIDMAQIEAKENYSFVSRLTRIISVILIGFSILSVCLFVTNVLRKHLEKIKMNIGTFKAFGLSNKILQKIYLLLIIRFILLSISISLVFAFIWGYIGGMRLLLLLFGNSIEDGESYFKLFDCWTLFAIITILLISVITLYYTANKILRRSPGDLIYNRAEQKRKKRFVKYFNF